MQGCLYNSVESSKNEDRKRPTDSGVLLMPRNKKNKNKIAIGEQSGVKK